MNLNPSMGYVYQQSTKLPWPPPGQAGIWDWLQEEAPQMLPMLLRLVRQALPPPPAVTWQRRSIELGIKHPPSQLTVTIVTVTTRITSTVYIHFTYCIFLQGIPINFPLLLWSKASPSITRHAVSPQEGVYILATKLSPVALAHTLEMAQSISADGTQRSDVLPFHVRYPKK